MTRAQSSWLFGLLAGLLLAAAIWFGLTQWPGSTLAATNATAKDTAMPSAGLDHLKCLQEAFKAASCYLPQPDRAGNGAFNENGTFVFQNQTYPCHCNTRQNESWNVTDATPWPDENEAQPSLEPWPDADRIQTTVISGPKTGQDGLEKRADGAIRITSGAGSDQNPAFLDENTLVFTRFADGYNQGPASLMGIHLSNQTEFVLWQDEAQNVNTNGNPFTPDRKQICYASDVEETDEIWCMKLSNLSRTRITRQGKDAYFEPSVSHDGSRIAFEMHREGNETASMAVTDFAGNVGALVDDGADNRLPQFNPSDGRVLFQRRRGPAEKNVFRLAVRHENGTLETLALPTQGGTDAAWSGPEQVVYSSEDERFPHAKIFSFDLKTGIGRQETFEPTVEDGAPAASPDGQWLAFESHQTSDPESPTRIWIVRRP